MVDMSEACLLYRKLLLELLQLKDYPDNIKIICKTDNSCLYDAVHSSTQIMTKRLHEAGHFERNGRRKHSEY